MNRDELLACRSRWSAALLAADRLQVLSFADDLQALHEVELLGTPRAGLGMVRLRDSVRNEAFHLGEAPLATSCVRVTARDGRAADGGAALLADDAELATAAAIVDAVLAADLPGAAEAALLVGDGLRCLAEREVLRQAIRQRTTVRFSLLSQQAESEDEP